MSKRLYKYVGPTYLDRVFSGSDHITFKCSYPKDFNDPYELFLTIDFNEEPGALAFYEEVTGKLPQLPTTCFSRSPTIVPMWAHYAQNLEGIAVEIAEDAVVEAFPESGFGDVDYRDTPHGGLKDMLYRAYRIGKPRYIYLLEQGVFSAAYYTKANCWAYELERRMVVDEREMRMRRLGELMLADVPQQCVTSLIVGPRASEETRRIGREHGERIGCDYYEMKIGRSSTTPYFIDSSGHPSVFDGSHIKRSSKYCCSCKEPVSADADECSWCRIEDSHRSDAASRNIYRMLENRGMLEKYIESMDAITRGARRK